jgi:hypothetical protein
MVTIQSYREVHMMSSRRGSRISMRSVEAHQADSKTKAIMVQWRTVEKIACLLRYLIPSRATGKKKYNNVCSFNCFWASSCGLKAY